MDKNLCANPDLISVAYASGVPMGGDLMPSSADEKPEFLAYAVRDPMGQKLEALHLIKGWVDSEGKLHNEVITIASHDSGANSLCTLYTDANFDPGQSTYYYLRVVEPATPRWHTYDCAKIPEADQPAVCGDGTYPETVQEMAWTSPIWYRGQP